MAVSEQIPGITNVVDKPRMLLSLLKEYIPDENHPLRDPSVLSHVISDVKSGKLLSESSSDQKVVERWKSAVDAWVNRILALASGSMPGNCWIGIWLLGLTSQECCSERFLASYSVWFNEIFSHIQPPSTSNLRVASCLFLSGLMMRLGEFPKAKKDGNSHAIRLVQRLLKLLNEDGSDYILEEALYLLCVVMNVFPSSVGRDYDHVEATIVSKIMSGNANANVLKKLSRALALLPKSRGDEVSWLMMMQKILVFINNQLKVLFQGLEEEASGDEVMKILLPSGKDLPPPLGGFAVSGKLPDLAIQRPEQFLISGVSTLMLCCCEMLSIVYPVQVTLPVFQILALVRRVLRVDGSLSHAYPFTSAMNLEFVRLGLPELHMHSLELLDAIVKGLHIGLYCHLGDIIRLLKEYFQTCAHPELRVKVYSIVKLLLESVRTGAAVAEDLIQEIINNAFIDLDTHDQQRIKDSAAPEEALQQPPRKKRKHPTTPGSLRVQSDQGGPKADGSRNVTLIAVRIAALEALGALVTVAGAWKSDSWRPSVDGLIMTVATNACEGWWAREKSTSVYADATSVWADFQLAALHAFLKSLLSPGRARSPHLAQGRDIFQRGAQETGTKIAEFCLEAMLDLDLLMHPRAFPVTDFQSRINHLDNLGIKIPEIMYHSSPFRVCTGGKKGPHEAESYEDDLHSSWLGNGEVMEEDPEVNLQTKARNAKEAPGTPKHPSLEKVSDDFPSGTSNHEVNRLESSAADLITQISGAGDEMMVEFQKQETLAEPEERDHTKGWNPVSLVRTPPILIGQSDQVVSGSGTLEEPTDHASTSGKDAFMADKEAISGDDKSTVPTSGNGVETSHDDVHNTILENISASVSNAVYEMDDDSSVESLPDIVDADPDSD